MIGSAFDDEPSILWACSENKQRYVATLLFRSVPIFDRFSKFRSIRFVGNELRRSEKGDSAVITLFKTSSLTSESR